MDLFSIHTTENNAASQAYLNEFRHKFAESAFMVFTVLISGQVLTTDNARALTGTRSLSRRICDLKQHNNIRISSEWVYQNGRRTHMQWWMSAEDKAENLKLLLQKVAA